MNAIEKACKIPGSVDKNLGAAYPIMHNIDSYSIDGYPYKYLDYIKKPMSIGQILGQLIERVAYSNTSTNTNTTSKKSKQSKKSNKSQSQSQSQAEVIITSMTVPFYYYGGDVVDEIITDIDLLVSNIVKYGKAIDEDPDEIVLKDAKMVVAVLHTPLDEYIGIPAAGILLLVVMSIVLIILVGILVQK